MAATLKIVLLADETVVAESEDAALWLKALGVIVNALPPSDETEQE